MELAYNLPWHLNVKFNSPFLNRNVLVNIFNLKKYKGRGLNLSN